MSAEGACNRNTAATANCVDAKAPCFAMSKTCARSASAMRKPTSASRTSATMFPNARSAMRKTLTAELLTSVDACGGSLGAGQSRRRRAGHARHRVYLFAAGKLVGERGALDARTHQLHEHLGLREGG